MICAAQPSTDKFDRQFQEAIYRQNSLEDAATILAEAAAALNWDLAAFHLSIDALDLPRGQGGTYIAERMGWCSASLEGWRRFELGRDCPIGSRAARTREPFFWTCDDRQTSWFDGEMGSESRRVLNYYGRFISSGVAVPVHRGACAGYVSWCSRDRDAHGIASSSLSSMFFISHVFMNHIENLLVSQHRERGTNQLTGREIECLTWAARGKSEEAIALLLHRSRQTVHFHLQNALKKLEAANRTHAVAIACTRGLVSLR